MKGKIRYKGIASHKRKIYICLSAIMGALATGYFLFALTHKTKDVLGKVFDASAVTVAFQDIYSDEIKTTIQLEIKKYFSSHTIFSYHFNHFFADLKAAYPMIKDIAWQHKSPHKPTLVVSGYLPVCTINGSHVLLRPGVLVKKDAFLGYQNSLNECFVDEQLCQKTEPLSSVVKFVDSLDEQVWQSYQVFYTHDAQIKLVKKNQGIETGIAEEIIVDNKVSFDDESKRYIEQVVGDLTQKNEFPKKKNSKIVFDLRLHNRILVQVFEAPAMGRKGR